MMELQVIVPTSLSEITLEQYQRFARLEGDDEFLSKKMLEIFCGVPIGDLPGIKLKDVRGVFKHINLMLQEKPSLCPRFDLSGKEFGFIPSLDDISYGEFIDLDNYLQETQDLHKAMAVLYRPVTNKVGKRYDIEPYESASKYCEQMKGAPMSAVMGALVFFYRLGNELLNALVKSLEADQESKILAHKDNSPNAGDGIQHSISLLRGILADLQKLESSPSIIA